MDVFPQTMAERVLERMVHSSPEVADGDNMRSADPERYLRVGSEPVSIIARLLDQNGLGEPASILDFACGWGRVTRHFRTAFPEASITCLDVWKEAVEHCAGAFGNQAIVADHALTTPIDEAFDLVWSGSLITHLPEAKARRALNLMVDALQPDGLLVFTTHGRYVLARSRSGRFGYNLEPDVLAELCTDFDRRDFSFTPYVNQTEYGISLTRFRWIGAWIEGREDLTLRTFVERGWDDHQDLVAVQKVPIHP